MGRRGGAAAAAFTAGNDSEVALPPHPPAPGARAPPSPRGAGRSHLTTLRLFSSSPRWGEGISTRPSNAIALPRGISARRRHATTLPSLLGQACQSEAAEKTAGQGILERRQAR